MGRGMKTYTPDQMRAIIDLHDKWLRGEDGGVRADLSDSDLRGSVLHARNLRDSVLHGSDLRDSVLHGSDLSGSDLSDSDLRGSNLNDSVLHGSNLSGASGIVPLPVGDPRGYRPCAVLRADGWRIQGGCAWFTVAEARAHYDPSTYHTPWLGHEYVRAIDWLCAWDALVGRGAA